MKVASLIGCLVTFGLFISQAPLLPAQAKQKPVKVFILAGQSNMEGQAVADLTGKDYNFGKGTLKELMKDPAKAPLFAHLKDEKGDWTVRRDVWVRYQPENGPLKAGPLTLGFTRYGGKHHFGPELQFGHVVADQLKQQVLLVKTCWGGKSLYKDFRPPSSGGEVGPYYTKMIAQVRQALADLKSDFPEYDGGGYELAGFVWYHGWNDGVDPKNAVPEYEKNLINLIKDVRKDLGAPRLPVVMGELTGPWVKAPGAWDTLRKAQAAAARQEGFKGNVAFVETHDFVRKPEDSPNPGHGHHEFGNAETYFLVGDALGKGMIQLLRQANAADPVFEPDQSKLPVTPPKGAKVLLDAKGNHLFLSMAGEKINWPFEDGALVSTPKKNQNHIISTLHFKDADLHVEFLLPEKGPANSGVYIHGNYEVQILNSFGKEKVTQEDAGALYGFAPPLENACRKPGEWQVFDIRYRAPRRDEAGKIVEKGTVTVWFNGKKVQDGTSFGEPKSAFHPFRYGTTPYLEKIRDRQKKTMIGPVFLQDHGNPVRFRNVWVVPADEHAFMYEPENDAQPKR